MPKYIWNGGSPIECPNIFETEEAIYYALIYFERRKSYSVPYLFGTEEVLYYALIYFERRKSCSVPYFFGTEEVLSMP